jgi:uncharacterized protein YndB with AHSA1/START domain
MAQVPGSTKDVTGEVTVTRTLEAPRELVWRAWTRPEHFTRWFGTPPFTTPLDRIAMDVRPGGEWRAMQVSSDGTEMPFIGVYREIAEPERLVFTFDDPQDRSDPRREVVTVTLAEADGATEMTLHQEGHLPAEQYVLLQEGYSLFFDRLAAHVHDVATAEFTLDGDRPAIVMRRLFDAPRGVLFDAMTDPESLKRWYGPRRLPVDSAEVDLRPGGHYRIVQRAADGALHGFHGEYREVVPGERLVQTWIYEGYPDSVAVITGDYDECDGMTWLTSTTVFPSFADRQGNVDSGAEAGARESWDRLAELMEAAR